MKLWDMILAGLLFAGAVWYLYRKIVKGHGFCPGCDQGCSNKQPQAEIKKTTGYKNPSKEAETKYCVQEHLLKDTPSSFKQN